MFTATFYRAAENHTLIPLPQRTFSAETCEKCDYQAFKKWAKDKYARPGQALVYRVTDSDGNDYATELEAEYYLAWTPKGGYWIPRTLIREMRKIEKSLDF